MAGVSSESLAVAHEQLEAKLPFASLSLAEELFGILGVLDSNAGIRRALTDPARPSDAKAALVSQLVRGKVSAQAESIVADLVSSRWRSPRDLGDALEELAATVVSATAENRGSGLLGLDDGLQIGAAAGDQNSNFLRHYRITFSASFAMISPMT